MHYVGTGVGHRKTADFPREDGQLKTSLSGEFYMENDSHNEEAIMAPEIITSIQPDDKVYDDEEELEGAEDDDDENNFEEVYEL